MLREPLDCNLRILAVSAFHGYGNTTIDNEVEQFAIVTAKSLFGHPELAAWPLAFYLQLEAYTHYMYGRYEESFACYDQAEKIASENGFNDLLLKIGIWRVLACRRAGRQEEAESIAERLQPQLVARTEPVVAPVNFARALLAFDRGDFDVAVPAAISTVEITVKGGQYNGAMLVRLVCANLFIGSGCFTHAEKLLQDVRAEICGPITSHYLAAIDLNEAWLDHRRGFRVQCRETLRKALERASEYRARQRLRWYPNILSELLPIALQENIEVDVALRLIKEFDISPAGPATETWPWPVKIRALGAFELLIDGQPPDYSRKAPRKVLALLKAIIAFGGTDVPEKRLTDALWPDDDGDAARRSLTATLHRLRKLLAQKDAVLQTEGRLSLSSQCCWVDALVVNRIADEYSESEYMCALYRGAFLDMEDDMPWILPMREKLRGKFIQAVGRRGTALEDEGQYERAVELYQRGIDADSLIESFYQGLMRCLERLDRKAEAASIFRRLRQTLSVTLGVQPSAASQRLFESLRSA